MGRGEWKIRVGRGEWDEGSGEWKEEEGRGWTPAEFNLFFLFRKVKKTL